MDGGRIFHGGVGLGLLLVLVVSAMQFPSQVNGFLRPVWEQLSLWNNPAAQYAASADPAPFMLLRDADAILPREASVLLVTDGSEVRRREYITFHRALYFLLPRAVWWISPAPSDGTWESKWWQSAPHTSDAILSAAREKGADYILLVPNTVQVAGTIPVQEWSEGALFAVKPKAVTQNATTEWFAGTGWWWQSALAITAVLAVGGMLLVGISRTGFVFGSIEALALAWAVGAGAVSFALVGLNALGIAFGTQVIVVGAIALGGAAVVAWNLRAWRTPRIEFGWHTLASVGLVLWLAVQTIYVAVIASGQPLVFWDSWVTWGMKARAIFVEQGIGANVFADPSRMVTHLDYPLLLPLVEAWLYQWLGAPDDRFAGLIAVAFYLALVGVMYAGARRLGADSTRALLGAAVAGSIPTLTLLAGEGFADVPLAVCMLLTGIFLIVWVERRERGALLLAVCGAVCLPWVKREGMVFLVALCGMMLLLARRDGAWRGILLVLGTGAAVAGGWAIFLAIHGTSNSDFLPLTLATLMEQNARAPMIADYFFNSLKSEWSGVWLLVLVVVSARLMLGRAIDGWTIVPRDVLLLAPLVYLVLMGASFIFSGYMPLINHLNSAGFRLVAQVIPLVVVWVTVQGGLMGLFRLDERGLCA